MLTVTPRVAPRLDRIWLNFVLQFDSLKVFLTVNSAPTDAKVCAELFLLTLVWSSSPGVFSGYSGFLPSFIGLMVQPIK